MDAYYLTKFDSPEKSFELRPHHVGKLESDQVKIQTEGFGLNFADVVARQGLYRGTPALPCVLGYEVVGRITHVGSEEDTNLIGKRVLAFTRFGGYAQECIVPKVATVEIPEDLDMATATALSTQYVTAWYCAYRAANLQNGETILLHAAAGGVGIALIQLAKRLNCTIIANAGSDQKVKFLQDLGVDLAINYNKLDYVKAAQDFLKGQTVDVCFNSIGGKSFKTDRTLLGTGGRAVLYGVADRSGKKWGTLSTINTVRKMGLLLPVALMIKSQSVHGVNMLHVGDHKPHILQEGMQTMVELYKKGEISPVIHNTYSHQELNQAHSELENRSTIGKIAIKWD